MTKEEKKIKNKNKWKNYVILIMLFIILFILYHLLLQYSENLQNSLNIQEKYMLNLEENIKGREKELNLSHDNQCLYKQMSVLELLHISIMM